MNKLFAAAIMVTTASLGLSTTQAFAEVPTFPTLPVNVSIENDTFYAIETEEFTNNIELRVDAKGFYGETVHSFNIDNVDFNRAYFETGYEYNVTDQVLLTGYGQLQVNDKYKYDETIIGVKAKLSF